MLEAAVTEALGGSVADMMVWDIDPPLQDDEGNTLVLRYCDPLTVRFVFFSICQD